MADTKSLGAKTDTFINRVKAQVQDNPGWYGPDGSMSEDGKDLPGPKKKKPKVSVVVPAAPKSPKFTQTAIRILIEIR